MDNNISVWIDFIEKNVKGKKTQQALIKYTEVLLSKNSVVIYNFFHLSSLLGIEKEILGRIIYAPEHFYHTFKIPKRNGDLREICAPSPVLLNCQRWIYENILKNIPVHENCYGFRENYSIVNNANLHIENENLLKLDLKDFFPSIQKERIIAVFINLGYTPKLAYCLASICCLNNGLPQGAATSPVLSNIIAKRMDYRVNGLAKKFNLNYSRYADDLTFSGKHLPAKYIKYIKDIIENEGFIINENKTKILSKGKRKIITGISVSSGKMTIPKRKKRQIRQIVFYINNYGIENHLSKRQIKDPIYLERILGYLFFWKSIEPKNKYVIDSIEKLKLQLKILNEKYVEFKEKLEYIG